MKTAFILICTLLLCSCSNTSGPSFNLSIQPGTFTGTISLTNYAGTDSASTQQSHVEFTFTDSSWYKFSGGVMLYGGGEYQFKGDSLYLQDMLARPEIFYNYQILEGSLYAKYVYGKLTLIQDNKKSRQYIVITLTRG